jgi:hypothetical protein
MPQGGERAEVREDLSSIANHRHRNGLTAQPVQSYICLRDLYSERLGEVRDGFDHCRIALDVEDHLREFGARLGIMSKRRAGPADGLAGGQHFSRGAWMVSLPFAHFPTPIRSIA